MKDEKELIPQCSKKTSFKIPEGYFEHFHEQLMSSLPEVEPTQVPAAQVTLMMRFKPLIYMAAMFAGIIFMVQTLLFVRDSRSTSDSIATIEDVYTDEVDHFMSSSLYDEYVLYSYLTATDYN